jgi:hypothetical protein
VILRHPVLGNLFRIDTFGMACAGRSVLLSAPEKRLGERATRRSSTTCWLEFTRSL